MLNRIYISCLLVASLVIGTYAMNNDGPENDEPEYLKYLIPREKVSNKKVEGFVQIIKDDCHGITIKTPGNSYLRCHECCMAKFGTPHYHLFYKNKDDVERCTCYRTKKEAKRHASQRKKEESERRLQNSASSSSQFGDDTDWVPEFHLPMSPDSVWRQIQAHDWRENPYTDILEDPEPDNLNFQNQGNPNFQNQGNPNFQNQGNPNFQYQGTGYSSYGQPSGSNSLPNIQYGSNEGYEDYWQQNNRFYNQDNDQWS